ncbi:MAG: PTS sugar transporter subunit IIA [Planctomycetia bacterium]|nr:PTS sugar transporter subunit IIA [Planctomycetia bacterium]
MPLEYFTVEQLATYLHFQTQQVQRLAERGKIPAKRVGGEWRFSKSEIHHWLEEKIGLADEDELRSMQHALDSVQLVNPPEDMAISEMLLPSTIQVPLPGRSPHSVIDAIVDLAMRSGELWDEERMKEAVRERENMYPTAMENGVALLHPRRPLTNILGGPFLALGRTLHGVPFSHTGVLTDIFFLICSTTDHQHLRTLARLSRIITTDGFLPALRELEEPMDIIKLFRETEENLSI